MTINTKDFEPRRPPADDDDDDRDDTGVEILDDELIDDVDLRKKRKPGGRMSSATAPMPDIDALLAEYSDTGRYVMLERWELAAWTFLDKLDYPDASLVAIKTRFGGGKYRMRIMGEDATKQRQITFRIAGRSRDGENDVSIPSSPNPPNGDSETIRELRERLAAIEGKNGNGEGKSMSDKLMDAVVLRLLEPPVRDPLVGDLLKAVVGSRENSGDGVDPIELQQLLNDAREQGYQQGKALGEALATAVGDGDPVARVLATTLPSVVDAFKESQRAYVATNTRRNPPAKATARVTEPTAANPTPKTTEEIPVSFHGGPGWINALRPAAPMLVKWAQAGKDAGVKAANTVDDLNDDVREAIAIQAESPDFVQTVIDAVPEFQAEDVKPWIVAFLSTIQGILTEPEGDAISQPGENAEIAEA